MKTITKSVLALIVLALSLAVTTSSCKKARNSLAFGCFTEDGKLKKLPNEEVLDLTNPKSLEIIKGQNDWILEGVWYIDGGTEGHAHFRTGKLGPSSDVLGVYIDKVPQAYLKLFQGNKVHVVKYTGYELSLLVKEIQIKK